MKYSRHSNRTSPAYSCGGVSLSDFYYTYTYGGQTAGGSSGGPITNSTGHVVGQLKGKCGSGIVDCDYSTYNNIWGRFNVSWSVGNLQYWLSSGAAASVSANIPYTSWDYGDVTIGYTQSKNFYIYNNGTVPNYLNLQNIGGATITGTNANQFSIAGSSSFYLPPGTNDHIVVTFTPTSAGTKTATLNIPHNADNISSPKTITLTGLGIPDPCDNIITIGGAAPVIQRPTPGADRALVYVNSQSLRVSVSGA